MFIDIPLAALVTHFEDHEYEDPMDVLWTQAPTTSTTHLEIAKDPQTGVAYTLYTNAPPEGYFPPNEASASFDF